MDLKTPPVTKTGLLIRRPAAQVFEAFADPAITTRFWFSKSSGRLEPGAKVRWDWEMYGPEAGSDVEVKAIEPAARILIAWGYAGAQTEVEWRFEPRGEHRTLVTITHSGFTGTADEQVAAALDSMQGFSLTLAGCKALLEHGLELSIVRDVHPDALAEGWRS
jgi:uncharacterized protein YndB with AHSA1/START domain